MKVIILHSDPNNGKTATLKLLYSLFLLEQFILVPGTFKNYGRATNLKNDFRAVILWKEIKVGILTRGDLSDKLKKDLNILNGKGCQLVICACRTELMNIVQEGHPEIYPIAKSTGGRASLMHLANTNDAKKLLELTKAMVTVMSLIGPLP